MGDTSDNIPGVPGIGEKTALELIKKYHSIEGLYEKIEKNENIISKLTINLSAELEKITNQYNQLKVM